MTRSMDAQREVGIVVFPGSNCDQDTIKAVRELGATPRVLDYRLTELPPLDRLILPGGFSYGDYLRSGALAAAAPIMDAVDEAALLGMPVLGICNGFQILCERGLLPGALLPNPHGTFISQLETVRVTAVPSGFSGLAVGDHLALPIAHHEGSYRIAEGQLHALFEQGQVFLQYSDPDGAVHALTNPNGSVANIAGIASGSVVGLMPHPERAMAEYLGSADGRRFLQAWFGQKGSPGC